MPWRDILAFDFWLERQPLRHEIRHGQTDHIGFRRCPRLRQVFAGLGGQTTFANGHRRSRRWQVYCPIPVTAVTDLDPFVQSVSQYVGRRVWHQVLLAFNLLARLLPPNPSEEDVRLLRRSMAQISTEVMHQTDLECHAVLFRAPAHKRSHVPRKPRRVSRQSSWEAMVAGSSRGSPKGGQTPVRSDVPLVGYRHRPALVLSQRAPSDTLRHQGRPGRVGADSQARKRPRVRRVVHVGSSGLFSPTDELLLDAADDSPVLSFSFAPIGPGESPLNEAGFSDGLQPLSLFRSDSIQNLELNQDSNRWHITVGAAEHSSRPMPDFSEASGISSPMHDDEPPSPEKPQQARWNPNRGSQRLSTASASSSLAALEAPLLGHARGDRRRRRLPACLAWGFCEDLWGSAEAWFRLLCTPCQAAYRGYLRTLRGISALGGVGRQSGLFLRHRKPRGSQVTTLLCLLLWLLVATMLFIAQSTVLFRLGRHHYSFFAALLSPPFAEIMALVHGVMFVCGATDGSTVCMFVVASISSMAVALICRINAVFYVNMDAIYVEGLLHVMAEYGIAFASKVFICRLVNMMIAYAEAEPVLDPSAGHEADHAWVREHVLFRARSGRAASPLRQRVGSDMSSGWTSTEEAADWTATMRMRRRCRSHPRGAPRGQEDDDSPSQHESRQVSPSQFESHPEFFPQTSGGSLSDSPRAHQD
ncbi:unnamed protein product [Prorocentrum cordatum]|uniref:Uncharacterized protein n=1 Tax=Prorocentrum cordatum TaxID=2364126 RepID=A0ABN9SXF7_9DINO|nr:unnamed protein product [Polarella glacialis]